MIDLKKFVDGLDTQEQVEELIGICFDRIPSHSRVQEILEENFDKDTRADWAEGWFDPDR